MVKANNNLCAVGTIVEDSKRYGWNKILPLGCHLTQDIETQLGAVLLVTERFLKSANNVWTIIHAQNRTASCHVFESIQGENHPVSSRVVRFPAQKSIVDAFKSVCDIARIPQDS